MIAHSLPDPKIMLVTTKVIWYFERCVLWSLGFPLPCPCISHRDQYVLEHGPISIIADHHRAILQGGGLQSMCKDDIPPVKVEDFLRARSPHLVIILFSSRDPERRVCL